MYEFPSASVTRLPLARTMKRGTPPTARQARTGLFTPPGICAHASPKSFSDVSVRMLAR